MLSVEEATALRKLLILAVTGALLSTALTVPTARAPTFVDCAEGWTLDLMSSAGVALFQPGEDFVALATRDVVRENPIPIELVQLSLVSTEPILVKLDNGTGTTEVCRSPPYEWTGHDETQTQACFYDPRTGHEQCMPIAPDQCESLPPDWYCVSTTVHVVDTWAVDTEMTMLDLRGTMTVGPPGQGGTFGSVLQVEVLVSLNPAQRTPGKVTNMADDGTGQLVGGDSFFDITYMIEFRKPGDAQTLLRGTNCVTDGDGHPVAGKCQPFRVEAHFAPTTTLPPHSDNDQPYLHPAANSSVVWSTDGIPLGSLISGCHKPYQTAFPIGHRICTLFSGTESSDDVEIPMQDCVQNNAKIGVVDISNPPHAITGVLAATVGPLTLGSWGPDGSNPDMWVSSASTTSVPCAAVGASLTATLSPHHTSPTVSQSWMQHH